MDKMKEITNHEISGDASQPAVLEVFWGAWNISLQVTICGWE